MKLPSVWVWIRLVCYNGFQAIQYHFQSHSGLTRSASNRPNRRTMMANNDMYKQTWMIINQYSLLGLFSVGISTDLDSSLEATCISSCLMHYQVYFRNKGHPINFVVLAHKPNKTMNSKTKPIKQSDNWFDQFVSSAWDVWLEFSIFHLIFGSLKVVLALKPKCLPPHSR